MKKLSARQKAVLCQASDRAYDRQRITAIDRNTYRRDEVERAVGKAGLRECDNGDYNKLASHFADLAGESGSAFNHLMKEQSNPRRQMENVLNRTLTAAGLPAEYAASIALARWKKTPDDLDDAQFRQLLITCKSRAAARRRKASAPQTSDNPY